MRWHFGVQTRGSVLAVFVLEFALGCSSNETKLVTVGTANDFSPVGNVLERRCGSLDCHGNPARSFRVYGRFGMRAAGQDRPGGRATTSLEVEKTWESLVLVDPLTLEEVRDKVRSTEQWLPLAKGSGRIRHKGGVALPPNSAARDCLTLFALASDFTNYCLKDEFGPIPKPGAEF